MNANTVLLVPMEMVTEALPAVTMEIILMAATVTLEDLTSADLTLEDSETFAVTPVSISRDASGATSNEGDLHMQAAANFINNGRYQEAINVLNGIDNKTAQWYYYSAIANSGIGNNVIALQHAREAARMEPNNIQYTTLVQRLENGGNWYRQQQGPYQTTFSSSGDWCVKLCIANLVCNLCCGGSGLCCGGNGMNGGHYI